MVNKTQLAFLLVTCAVIALLIQPAVSQQDILRWGKRDSDLSDEHEPESLKTRRRQYNNEEDYYSKPSSLPFSYIVFPLLPKSTT